MRMGGMSVDSVESKILEIQKEEGECDEEIEERIERWVINQKKKEREIKDRKQSETVLIVKRGARASRKRDFGRWLQKG